MNTKVNIPELGRLEQIRERMDAATPGPWALDEHYGCFIWGSEDEMIASEGADGEIILRGCAAKLPMENNALFIAYARSDVPFLLAEIERLTAALALAKAEAAQHCLDVIHEAEDPGLTGFARIGWKSCCEYLSRQIRGRLALG